MLVSEDIDKPLRHRLARWVCYFMHLHGMRTQVEMAERLGIGPGTLSNIINETRTMGLDVFVKVHKTFHQSADVLLSSDPPAYPERAREGPPSASRERPAVHGREGAGRRRKRTQEMVSSASQHSAPW